MGRLPLGSLYERFPVASHGEPLVKLSGGVGWMDDAEPLGGV
jgi:hypothetical protein